MNVIEFAGIIEPWVVAIGTTFQIIGTVTLSVFTLKGIKIEEIEEFKIKGKSLTVVSINKKWEGWAKVGFWVIIPGLALAALPHFLRSGHQILSILFG